MDLTEARVPHYLRERDILDGRRVVDVQGVTRRGFCATIELDDGTRWFLKQARRPREEQGEQLVADVAVANEAAVLEWARRATAGTPIRSLMPGFVVFDPDHQVLITEYLAEYRTLADHFQRRAVFGRAIAQRLAEHLARCHAIRPDDHLASGGRISTIHVIEQPLVTTWGHLGPEQIAAQPDAFVEFVELVQNTDGLNEALREIRANWRPQCLIHGDAKFDNVLLRPSLGRRVPDLRLVDWELAGWGDPAWDAGTVIGGYLHQWLESISPTTSGTLNEWLAHAEVPFERVQPALGAFWAIYAHRRSTWGDPPDAARAISYAGVFLLHRALATVLFYGSLSAKALCSLQVAKRLIRQPSDTVSSLLC